MTCSFASLIFPILSVFFQFNIEVTHNFSRLVFPNTIFIFFFFRVPTFLSLPLVIQLRFIIFLQSNISQVTSHAINTFLQRIETSQTNMWMKEAVCQLRNTIAQRSIEARHFSRLKDTKYTFTPESQNAFQAVTSRLINRKKCTWELCPGIWFFHIAFIFITIIIIAIIITAIITSFHNFQLLESSPQ